MILNKIKTHPSYYDFNEMVYYTSTTSLSLIYTWTAPITGYVDMTVVPIFGNASPTACLISKNSNTNTWETLNYNHFNVSGSIASSIASYYVTAGTNLYVYTAHSAANSNRARICGRIVPENLVVDV